MKAAQAEDDFMSPESETLELTNFYIDQQNKIKTKYDVNGFVTMLVSQKYDEIIKESEPFEDDLFPPNNGSIYNYESEIAKARLALYKKKILENGGKFSPQKKAPDASKHTDRSKKNEKEFSQVKVWRRLSEVYPDYSLVDFSANETDKDSRFLDINQGKLGDCYFLCALCAMCEFPDRIQMVFGGAEKARKIKNGCAEIEFYIHGKPSKIVVDDYAPFLTLESEDPEKEPENTDQLCFGKPNIIDEKRAASNTPGFRNLWSVLLEKAWAKLNINYKSIAKGTVAEAFEVLFPAPVTSLDHNLMNPEEIWQRILKADDSNYLICADITSEGNPKKKAFETLINSVGLINDHAYTVISARQVYDNEAPKVRLLELRNPWGKHEWTGDWSDTSLKWEEDWCKKQRLGEFLHNHDRDDGKFFIDFDNFVKHFSKTHICKVNNTFEYYYDTYSYDPNRIHNFIQVEIPSAGKTFFILNQKNVRLYRASKGKPNFDNPFVIMNVFRKDNNEYVFKGSVSANDNRISVEVDVEKSGTFIIAISFPQPCSDLVNKLENLDKQRTKHSQAFKKKYKKTETEELKLTYVVGVYSRSRNVTFGQFNYEANYSLLLFKDPLFKHAAKDPQKINFTLEEERESWRSIRFPEDQGGCGYLAYHNLSKGYIYEKITFTKFQNVNLTSLIDEGKNIELNLDDDMKMEVGSEEHELEEFFANQGLLNSRVCVLRLPERKKDKMGNVINESTHLGDLVSPDNPLIVQIILKPKDFGVLLFEKTAETSGIQLTSQIMFSYPVYEILRESIFHSRTIKLKYGGKIVDIIEYVIDHTNGVTYKYVNNTKNLKLGVFLDFGKSINQENLKISALYNYDLNGYLISDDGDVANDYNTNLKTFKEEEYGDELPVEKLENPNYQQFLYVPPGEVVIFELRSIDRYSLYSYVANIKYKINKCKDTRK